MVRQRGWSTDHHDDLQKHLQQQAQHRSHLLATAGAATVCRWLLMSCDRPIAAFGALLRTRLPVTL